MRNLIVARNWPANELQVELRMQRSNQRGGDAVIKPNRESKIDKQSEKEKVGGKRAAPGNSSKCEHEDRAFRVRYFV